MIFINVLRETKNNRLIKDAVYIRLSSIETLLWLLGITTWLHSVKLLGCSSKHRVLLRELTIILKLSLCYIRTEFWSTRLLLLHLTHPRLRYYTLRSPLSTSHIASHQLLRRTKLELLQLLSESYRLLLCRHSLKTKLLESLLIILRKLILLHCWLIVDEVVRAEQALGFFK